MLPHILRAPAPAAGPHLWEYCIHHPEPANITQKLPDINQELPDITQELSDITQKLYWLDYSMYAVYAAYS